MDLLTLLHKYTKWQPFCTALRFASVLAQNTNARKARVKPRIYENSKHSVEFMEPIEYILGGKNKRQPVDLLKNAKASERSAIMDSRHVTKSLVLKQHSPWNRANKQNSLDKLGKVLSVKSEPHGGHIIEIEITQSDLRQLLIQIANESQSPSHLSKQVLHSKGVGSTVPCLKKLSPECKACRLHEKCSSKNSFHNN
ncbi:hypothetical protein BX070DRAFT_234422 [Coemansia spiralis]|nr:hypothetical protein BX070DRAFT_234422 [Coemansia spiralis]